MLKWGENLSVFKSRAIIIKTLDYRENDKLVWLFSEKLGKISSIAHGAKKSKNRLSSLTLPFCYGEYVLFKGKNLYTINEGEIIDSFQSLLGDLDTLMYASYLCELIDIAVQEEESNRDLFREFVTAFYLVKNRVGDIEVLVRAFEVKLLFYTGYGLNLETCSHCKKKINTSDFIDFISYGGICDSCNKANGLRISRTAYNILKYLSMTPLEKICRLNVSEELKNELEKVMNEFIHHNYSRKPKSLEMINLLKRSDKK